MPECRFFFFLCKIFLFLIVFSFSYRFFFFLLFFSDDKKGISVRTELVVHLQSQLVGLHHILISSEGGH